MTPKDMYGATRNLPFVQSTLTISERGYYAEASPCIIASLPQSRLEPILVRYAAQNGLPEPVRYQTVEFRTR